MIAVFFKDLREMWAGPVTLIALAVVSCLVMALAAALPLPERELRIGVAPTLTDPACHVLHPPPPDEMAAPPATEIVEGSASAEQASPKPNCAFPERDVLIHAIKDLAGARYHPVEPASPDPKVSENREDRGTETEAWEIMDRERLNVLFVWYPTVYTQDEAASAFGTDTLRSYGAESGGVWIAYTQARSTAHAGQIRFSVRQAQGSATLLANARKNGDQFASPSIGFADSFTELGSVFVGLRHTERLDEVWATYDTAPMTDDEAIRAVDGLIERYNSRFQSGPLPEAKAQQVRDALRRALAGPGTFSREELRQKFRAELDAMLPSATVEPQLDPAEVASPSDNEAPLDDPETALQEYDVNYFLELSDPGYSDNNLTPGEDPLLVLAPFLLTERDGPPRSTSAWLIPGLVLIIGSAIAFMLAAGSTVREREHGTEHLLKAGRPWWRAAIGKSLAPAAAAFVVLLMLMLTAQVFFGFQVKPAWPYAILCAAMAVLAASFQGVAVGSLLRSQPAALAISGAYLICLILFGNILIPMDGAVWPTSWLSQVLPTRLLSEEWADWMTWGVPLQIGLLLGLVLLLAASLGALLLGAFARQRSV